MGKHDATPSEFPRMAALWAHMHDADDVPPTTPAPRRQPHGRPAALRREVIADID